MGNNSSWTTVCSWQGEDVGKQHGNANVITGIEGNKTTIKSGEDVATKQCVIDIAGTRALQITPVANAGNGPPARAAGHNPTIGSEPLKIELPKADMQNATDLKIALKIEDNRERESYVLYIGFEQNSKNYYKRIELPHFFSWGDFYFVGKTYEQQQEGNKRRTYLPDEQLPKPLKLTKQNVGEIESICIWAESHCPNFDPPTPLLIGDISICTNPDGYDSSAEDATLKPAEPFTRDTDGGVIVLSFDDGPFRANQQPELVFLPPGGGTPGDRALMDHYMDIASEFGARFSFFLVEKELQNVPLSTLKRAIEEGHEIGNHTKTHCFMGALQTAEELLAEVDAVDNRLTKNGLQKTTIIRPPMLSVSDLFFDTLSAKERTETTRDFVVIGGRDPRDWRGTSVDMRVEFFVQAARDGAVLVLHDNNIDNIETVRRTVKALTKRGFKFLGEEAAFKELLGGIKNAKRGRGTLLHNIYDYKK